MSHETDSEFMFHEHCPKCDSEDNLARYDDGHAYCFGCEHYEPPTDSGTAPVPKRTSGKTGEFIPFTGEPLDLKARCISKKTCNKWGYLVGTDQHGRKIQIANYKDSNGNVVCQKIRWASKDFIFIGDTKNAPLYGQHLWRDGGRKVVITEGEIDALSVSEAQDNKYAVVSVPTGSKGAAKALARNLEWLEKFEEIILMFDMDEAGQQAVEKCVSLFTPGRVKVAKLERKDPNEHLQHGERAKIIDAIWGARSYQPDGVILAGDLRDKVNKKVERGLSYPYQSVTDWTYGIRPREIITLGAGTGMGKSDFYKEIATHLLMEHKQNVGMLYLEEAPEDTLTSVMSKHVSIPFHIPDSVYTQEQKDKAFDDVTSTNRLFLYDSFGYTDYEIIKSRIRYMVVSCGCKYIFLDHITALVSSAEVADERRELDNIMTSLASLVRELNFTLFLISHLTSPEGKSHEEGGRVTIKQFRGSRSIGQWSSFMIGLERNQQSEDEEERTTTICRMLKDRYTGRSTGNTQDFGYNADTGRMYEKEAANPFDPKGETNEEF